MSRDFHSCWLSPWDPRPAENAASATALKRHNHIALQLEVAHKIHISLGKRLETDLTATIIAPEHEKLKKSTKKTIEKTACRRAAF